MYVICQWHWRITSNAFTCCCRCKPLKYGNIQRFAFFKSNFAVEFAMRMSYMREVYMHLNGTVSCEYGNE